MFHNLFIFFSIQPRLDVANDARVGATNPGIIKSNTNPTPIAAKPQQEPKKEGGRGHGRSSGRGDGGGRDGGRGRGVVSSDARSLTKPMGK